ncbi:UDP-4-amino-4,6-dideoxy-N-acetyl-beta-L-altrosamine N-acetyltransferase [Thioalkalivibrio sp. AKL6]|uniref:UDP-4-amino-4, 6-dideoxy-N-acetyl-beta-L-altrosamine N-acetyltransferase n=1 Tax=Thioalkalivibrio sp. AKL6 TaxID=1158154 RepID=UPI000367A781|nr:UDP-4-amino-4,6-dideoxy-N-acetyl-beta-L-altrosamine N-acetyltransferase [Thioalkalivibrio sp. AKL6]
MHENSSAVLRPLAADDLEMVRAWRNHPDVRRFMYTQHTVERDEHEGWFEVAASNPDKNLLIFERGGVPSGFVNVTIADPSARRAEWGFYLAPNAEKGSGFLLGQLALGHVFRDLGQHKLCGEALAYNHRSIRFHERLGFRQEACLRDHHFDGNQFHDVIGFGLLATEWLEEKGDQTQ